jgi:hypothetical protein
MSLPAEGEAHRLVMRLFALELDEVLTNISA